MNASSLIRSHVLAVTADAFRANGISAPVVSSEEFQKMLDRHNFQYAHEDRESKYLAGLEADQNLRKIANSDPHLGRLYLEALHNTPEGRA